MTVRFRPKVPLLNRVCLTQIEAFPDVVGYFTETHAHP